VGHATVTATIKVSVAGERDYPAIARLQATSPEAAQWPVGDYSAFSLLLASIDGAAVGFCTWRQTVDDEAELLNLAVDPDFRRRGVGIALLAALEKAARGTIFLEVAETNAGAIALYRNAGWEEIAIRKGYYKNGNINAVVMKKRSCYSPG
jgi:ribosomal-protein-alanine N-acetyltransferase